MIHLLRDGPAIIDPDGDDSSVVHLYTGERSPYMSEVYETVDAGPAPTWHYNRRPDGVGELVLPVPGLRGPLHTIAPAKSRIPDGLWRLEPGIMATSGRPWMRILWGDPDGLDDIGIHAGNVAAESRGCPLVGLSVAGSGVASSAAAMRIVMAVGRSLGEQWIRVTTVQP